MALNGTLESFGNLEMLSLPMDCNLFICVVDNESSLPQIWSNCPWLVKQFKQEIITNGLTDGQTDRRMDRHYQVYFLPASLSYAVDNETYSMSLIKK